MPRSSGNIRNARLTRQRGRVRTQLVGMQRTKRLLRALPEAMRAQLVSVLERAGPLMAAAMQRRAPRKTGALVKGISSKTYGRSLRMRAGLIGTPTGRAKLFYGRILDLGRRAQVTKTRRRVNPFYPKRRRGRPGALLKRYVPLRVKAMAPKRFVTGSYPMLRGIIGRALQGVWGRALGTIGSGRD